MKTRSRKTRARRDGEERFARIIKPERAKQVPDPVPFELVAIPTDKSESGRDERGT